MAVLTTESARTFKMPLHNSLSIVIVDAGTLLARQTCAKPRNILNRNGFEHILLRAVLHGVLRVSESPAFGIKEHSGCKLCIFFLVFGEGKNSY